MSAIIDDVSTGRVIEIAKNATGYKFAAVLINEDDPSMPHELDLGNNPAFVEVIFTRPDGKQVRKRGLRPLTGQSGDDNEVYYTNRTGDGVNDMHGLWRYTVAAVLQDGTRVRSKESVRWYCVRGDPEPVGPSDVPAP